MPPVSDLAVERTGDTAVVALTAPCPGDEAAVHALGAALEGLLAPGDLRALVLDCTAVDYACSAFLGQVLRLRRKALAQSVTLELCGLNPQLAEVLRVTGADRLFPIYPDRAAALAARTAGSAP